MSLVDRRILNATGHLWIGDNPVYDLLDFKVTLTLNAIEAQLRNGIYVIPTEQIIKVDVVQGSINVDMLSKLTGGTLSTGSRKLVEETLTKSTNTLTLSQTPENVEHLIIIPVGNNTAPLLKVASAPAVGEFSVSGTTVTLNASQTETQFFCAYFYTDGSAGETLQINPTHLPTTTYRLFGAVPMADANTAERGYMVIECAKVQRSSGDFVLGGAKSSQDTPSLSLNVINTVPGDVKIYEYAV